MTTHKPIEDVEIDEPDSVSPDPQEPDAPRHRVNRRRWLRWIPFIAFATLGAAAGGWVLAASQTSGYSATALVAIDRDPFGELETRVTRSQLPGFVYIAESRVLQQTVATQLGLTAGEVDVSTSLDFDAAQLRISFSAPTEQQAIGGARRAVDEFRRTALAEQVAELEHERDKAQAIFEVNEGLVAERVARIRELRGAGLEADARAVNLLMWHTSNRRNRNGNLVDSINSDITIADGRIETLNLPIAATPNGPSAPLYAGLGAMAGLILTGAVASSSIGRRSKIDTLDQLSALVPDLPILAAVPRFGSEYRDRDDSLVISDASGSSEAEAIRFVRTSVAIAAAEAGARSLAMTSPHPGAGKTVTSANLAAALAAGGQRALLVDGDVLSSSVAEALRMARGVNTLPHVITRTEIGWPISTVHLKRQISLDFLGRADVEEWTDARPEVTTDNVRELLELATSEYDVTVLDCPPILEVADATTLCAAADATIVVVKLGETESRSLIEAVRQLRLAGVAVLGVIATHVPESEGLHETRPAARSGHEVN